MECDFFDAETYTAKKNSIAEECTNKTGSSGGVFLWGDSHAQALSYGLRQHIKEGFSFYQVASSGCRPHVAEDSESRGEFKLACDRSNSFALAKIKELKPDLVILAQKNDHDKNDYDHIVSELKRIGVESIIIVGPVPQWYPSLPRAISLRHFDPKEIYIKDSGFDKSVLAVDSAMRNKVKGVDGVYISIIEALCKNNGECLSKVDGSNTPLVWDYGHLSLEGSKFVVSEVLLKNSTFLRWFR